MKLQKRKKLKIPKREIANNKNCKMGVGWKTKQKLKSTPAKYWQECYFLSGTRVQFITNIKRGWQMHDNPTSKWQCTLLMPSFGLAVLWLKRYTFASSAFCCSTLTPKLLARSSDQSSNYYKVWDIKAKNLITTINLSLCRHLEVFKKSQGCTMHEDELKVLITLGLGEKRHRERKFKDRPGQKPGMRLKTGFPCVFCGRLALLLEPSNYIFVLTGVSVMRFTSFVWYYRWF